MEQPIAFDDAGFLEGFAERMRVLREGAGLTQHGLAKRSAIGRSTIAMIEAGRQNPSLVHVGRIAKALGVSTRALLGF